MFTMQFKISFDIWIFKNWIYTLHNNVHMLSSPYIYAMGSLLDQLCMPHYLPCKTMFIYWVHIMLSKYHIKKNPLDLVFKIGFENWTRFLVFFKETHFKYPKRISNAFLKYLTSFENVEYIIKQYLSDIQVSFHNPH